MGAAEFRIEGATALAHPADDLRRDSRDKRVRRDILGDDGPCRDHGVPPDGESAEDRGVRTYGGTVLDLRRYDLPIGTHRARVEIVGEASMRSDENTISDGNPSIEGCEVLDFAIVSDHDGRVYVHILANIASQPDACAFADLGPVPDRGTLSHPRLSRHVGTRMNSGSHSVSPACSSVFETLSGQFESDHPLESGVRTTG